MEFTIKKIFNTLPQRFRADKAAGYHGIFHFELEDEKNQKDLFTVIISAAGCEVTESLVGIANCTIKTKTEIYIGIETGKIKAQDAILSGKIQVDNFTELINYSKFFRKLEAEEKHLNISEVQTITRKPESGPLKGLKVLDFTRLLPGPLATMLMADMGAEVIKIEAPEYYDYTRNFPPQIGGESAAYLAFNRSKRSLSLDYSSQEGKAIILGMLEDVDILIEQFRPGVMQKMGLAYEDVKEINPKLIYVSVTGYGHTGPYANLAGHDLNYITFAGLLSGNQYTDPQLPLVQMADIAGGSYMAVIACLSAVYARNNTGKGQFVDVSMLDGVMPLNVNAAALNWATGKPVQRDESFLSGGLVNYNIYRCKGNRFVALGTLEDKFWVKFCEVIGKPEWKNRILAKNREELNSYKKDLEELFMTRELNYWVDLGFKHDLLLNAVYEMDEVEKDPHIIAREMIVEQEHPTAGKIKSIGIPLKFSDTKAKISWPPPLLGEDSLAIMQEAGVSKETIKELISKGLLKI